MFPFIFLYFIFALVMGRASYRMGAFNYGAPWNGYGTINPVLKGEADLPMQYRPLVPYLFELWRRLIGLPEDSKNVFRVYFGYEPLRILGMWLHLSTFHYYLYLIGGSHTWALTGTAVFVALLTATFLYDYTDCYYEGLFWGLCLIGVITQNWWLALGSMFVGTFNKETMIFVAPLAALYVWNLDWLWWLAASFAASYAVMFFIWGHREHYHIKLFGTRWMFKINWADVKFAFSAVIDQKARVFRIFYYEEKLLSLVLIALMAVLFISSRAILPEWLLRMWMIVPAFVFCTFAYARYLEMRVFMPLAYVLIPSLLWGLR